MHRVTSSSKILQPNDSKNSTTKISKHDKEPVDKYKKNQPRKSKYYHKDILNYSET